MGCIILQSQPVNSTIPMRMLYGHTLDGFSARSFLEIYQKCETSTDIDAAQKKIMDDLEADWNEARRRKGSCKFKLLINLIDILFSKTLPEMNLKTSFSPIRIMELFLTMSLKMMDLRQTTRTLI